MSDDASTCHNMNHELEEITNPVYRKFLDSIFHGGFDVTRNRNSHNAAGSPQQTGAIPSGTQNSPYPHTNVAVTTLKPLAGWMVVLGLLLSLIGCGGESTVSNNTNAPPAKVGTPSGKQLPSGFRVLAEHIVLEIKPSPEDFRDDKGLSEIIAEGHSAVLALRGIQSADSDVTYVATQGQAAFGEAVSRLERINAMPKPPGAGSLFVESFIHGLYGNVFYGYALGVDAEEKQKGIMAEVHGLMAAMDKADAAQMMLPRIAEKYAATPSAPNGRLVIDIDESWGWYGPNDWLKIYNAGPQDLEDCTIQVHLTGESGPSRKNVHFIKHWPANSWMYARYEPGEEILDRPEAGKSTVTKIQEAEVSIWSPKYTTTLSYVYQGAEKDKDIADWCKDLKFTGRYKPFVPGTLWDDQRGAEFTLDGVAIIPKCRVDITFREGEKSKAWHWEHDSWVKGEKKTFTTASGDLTFDPSHIDMAISFPDTSYRHEVTLTVHE